MMNATASPTDQELLQTYVESRCDTAFADLVERYATSVTTVACRRSGRRDLAEEAAQNVFVLLARKATKLTGHPTLAGWMHRSALYEAAKLADSEQARRNREVAFAQVEDGSEVGDWQALIPLLDQALNELALRDREVLLLHYFHRKGYQEIAELIGKSESARRMQASRALKRLAQWLSHRGVKRVGATLAGSCLSAQAMEEVDDALLDRWKSVAIEVSQTWLPIWCRPRLVLLALPIGSR